MLRDTNPRLRKDEFWANDQINLALFKGECLGIVGRNGSGKSTLLKLIAGLIKPDRGTLRTRGRVGALIELGAGMNPLLTGRENILINGVVLGMNRNEVVTKFDSIQEFADLGPYLDAPVQSYSSGMKVRLGFAIAVHLEPDLLLVDEVLAVGDMRFRARCYQKISSLLPTTAVIFISHNPDHILNICNRAILLDGGKITAEGSPSEVIEKYHRQYQPGLEPADKFVKVSDPFESVTIPKNPVEVQAGKRLRLLFECKTSQVVKNGIVRLAIYDRQERFSLEWNSRNDGDSLNLAKGEGQSFIIDIEQIPLKSGSYVASLIIHIGNSLDHSVWISKEIKLCVVGNNYGYCDVQLQGSLTTLSLIPDEI